MWNYRIRKITGLVLLLFTIGTFNNCAAEKKAVDPYRDRSYTSSVAQDRKSNSMGSVSEQKTVPDRSEKEVAPFFSSRQNASRQDVLVNETMLPLLTLINDRIVAYEGKVEQWNSFLAKASPEILEDEQQVAITNCYDATKSILSGYEELHQELIAQGDVPAVAFSPVEQFLNINRRDIAYMEGECILISSADQDAEGLVTGARARLLQEKERELHEAMLSGEYNRVIALFENLQLEEGDVPSYETVYSYGQALLRTGREAEAAEVFQELLADLREQNHIEREFKLMQLVADIQFGLENFDQAFERYIHIINRYAGLGENIDWARRQQSMISARNTQGIEVRNYAELLRSYLTYNADRDAFKVYLLAQRFIENFPESSVLPVVNHILFESRDKAEAWFALFKQKINTFKGEKQYQDALQLIEQLPMQEMTMEKREELDRLTDELISASYNEQESKRRALEEAMQEIWSQGQAHLRAQEYDQAIEVFSTLLETTYAERANDKIIEASQLAAQENRREAAELFVRAGNTTDRETKLALLFQSRKLLKTILEKYPRSGLTDKAGKNLERIEDEIRSIDPALLNEEEINENNQADNEIRESPVTTVNGIPLGEWKEQVPSDVPGM